jgi:hypothetical protein
MLARVHATKYLAICGVNPFAPFDLLSKSENIASGLHARLLPHVDISFCSQNEEIY